jgi:tRNA nucleotidyltransferase (CCA-adding enzyme)
MFSVLKMKFKTYLCGGAVRDRLLGKKPKDLDFVVLAPSFEALENALKEDGAEIFISKPEYLTVRCKHPKFGVADFACARVDGNYSDQRRPDSTEITSDLIKDLSRRDFCCGAMALDMDTNVLIDPFGGAEDIEKGYIRCVGDPCERLKEDLLRVFRAIRFCVTLNFQMAHSVALAISDLKSNDFNKISSERIQVELFKMFSTNTRTSLKWFSTFPYLSDVMERKGIWLMPTLKEK